MSLSEAQRVGSMYKKAFTTLVLDAEKLRNFQLPSKEHSNSRCRVGVCTSTFGIRLIDIGVCYRCITYRRGLLRCSF